MIRRFARAASRCSFFLGLACATPCVAVNFEFYPAAPAERVAVSTGAAIRSPLGDEGSEQGIADLPIASAFAEAGATRFTPSGPVVIVSAEAMGEIETDIQLDSPTAFVGLVTPGQKATGFAAEAGTSFEASMGAMSAIDTINPIPVDWVVDVLPSAGETAGLPTQVSIDAVVEGLVSTTGRSTARASWLVLVNETAPPVLSGSASSNGGGVLPFSEAASHDFVLPLGSSFKLQIRWNLSVFGAGTSTAEFTAARIDLAATIIPEPGTLLLLVSGLAGSVVHRRRTRPHK